MNNPPNLLKMKIPELKHIAKQNKLHISGTKTVLIQRIGDYYNRCIIIIKIQKVIRGHFVRLSFKLRGAGFKDRTKCVNTTDFLTMEPLDEIPHSQFFSYTDDKDFIYGFDLNSLISLYKNKGKILNPYNRERIKTQTIVNMIRLYTIVRFTYTSIEPEPEPEQVQSGPSLQAVQAVQAVQAMQAAQAAAPPMPQNQYAQSSAIVISDYVNRMTDEQLDEIRVQPVNTRIIAVFMDIDQLGHYTNAEWFQNLDKQQYYNFFREIYNIWRFRAQLSNITKYRICRHDPTRVFTNLIYDEITIDALREGCLQIIENMVYPGVDNDHRNLGAFHILTALTVVSIPARTTMPWLYESIM